MSKSAWANFPKMRRLSSTEEAVGARRALPKRFWTRATRPCSSAASATGRKKAYRQFRTCLPANEFCGGDCWKTLPHNAAKHRAAYVRYNRGQEEHMARVPLTKEEVAPTRLVLNVEKVGFSEEQFSQLCSDNRDLRMEFTAQKELLIMPRAGFKSSWRNNILSTELTNWAKKDGTGVVCDSSAGYRLPNSAIRGPDVSWTRRERLRAFDDRVCACSCSRPSSHLFCGNFER